MNDTSQPPSSVLPDVLPQVLPSILPKFEIKQWKSVALWSWDITSDTCAI